jgi:cell division transport system permease protein
MFLTLKRTLGEALKNFFRNGLMSFAALGIMTFSLYLIGMLIFLSLAGNLIFKSLEEKADISVYFKPDIKEEVILEAKNEIEKNNQVLSATYISKDEALVNFKAENANEPIILESLEEIGENPLLASLTIQAKNPAQFPSIYEAISQSAWSENLSRINYEKNKELIDKITASVSTAKKVGLTLGIIFCFISILIIFNAIRLTIYNQKQEIEIMRLVGASNAYIRWPYIFEGIFYALAGTILALLFAILTIKLANPYFSPKILGQSLSGFFWQNSLNIFSLQLLLGIILGVFSSLIAIRKYLKI